MISRDISFIIIKFAIKIRLLFWDIKNIKKIKKGIETNNSIKKFFLIFKEASNFETIRWEHAEKITWNENIFVRTKISLLKPFPNHDFKIIS